MEIALLFALILLNGAFAMSEIALVTARKARLADQVYGVQVQPREGERQTSAATVSIINTDPS